MEQASTITGTGSNPPGERWKQWCKTGCWRETGVVRRVVSFWESEQPLQPSVMAFQVQSQWYVTENVQTTQYQVDILGFVNIQRNS